MISIVSARVFMIAVGMTIMEACSSSPRFSGRFASPGEPPAPSPYHSYQYLAMTNDCHCKQYVVTDRKYGIEYQFQASYKMDGGILTSVEIEIKNGANDTLYCEHATAKVTSLNVPYLYNDKFLPLPIINIPPGKSNVVHLSGKDRTGENDWHKIAGEQLTVTLDGLQVGGNSVAAQSVIFIPENPLMTK